MKSNEYEEKYRRKQNKAGNLGAGSTDYNNRAKTGIMTMD